MKNHLKEIAPAFFRRKLHVKSQFVEPKQKSEEKMLLNKNDFYWKTLPPQEIKFFR